MDIQRLKTVFADGFKVGDYIVIQEKLDGANASFQDDIETDEIKAFSRNNPLSLSNNLRGFWEWTQKLNKELYEKYPNLRVFGEWLVSHTIPYPQDKYYNFYCFDLYDTETQLYLKQDEVEQFCIENNLNYIPVFYKGEFISWEHIKTFVGKTFLGGERGEGVVVKNMDRLNDSNTRIPFYTKIVSDDFAETKSLPKMKDTAKLESRAKAQELTKTIVTEARVKKLVHKLVDEGIIPEQWDEQHMSIIAKNIGSLVYYDCKKEEPDIVEEIGELFGKVAQSTAMSIVRSML